MKKHPQLTHDKVKQVLPRIEAMIYGPSVPVAIGAHHILGEPISPNEAFHSKYIPFKVGDQWGQAWTTSWFHIQGEVPKKWKGKTVVFRVQLNKDVLEGFACEGLIWKAGKPLIAVNMSKNGFTIADNAKGGEKLDIFIEAAANTSSFSGTPDRPLNLLDSDPKGKKTSYLNMAEIAVYNPEAHAYWTDLELLRNLYASLPEDDNRKAKILRAINDSTNLFIEGDFDSIAPANAVLKPVLACRNGSSAHQVSAVGHSHIDTAWLWPLRETMRKCARTFQTQIEYMKKYPEYVFACSQAVQYAWMKKYYPTIFQGIKEMIKKGQWEPVGSMWVEMDCNLASGESMVRHFLHGKRFFNEEFGYETIDMWEPDVFGYSAALPQIMKKSGIRYFMTQKLSWNEFNKIPHHTFLWEGIDGTRIFSHFLPSDTYNANTTPAQLIYNTKNFKDKDRANRSLYTFGYGDGGGGPSIQMIENLRRMKNLEGIPKVTLEKAVDFFVKAENDATDLQVWVGELYFELHRGTYTTQARNKRGNRKCEYLIHDAEFFDSISLSIAKQDKNEQLPEITNERAVYDVFAEGDHTRKGYLDRAWKLLLLNQFHDIIPGSSIHWVYQDALRDYETIRQLVCTVLESTVFQITPQVDTRRSKKPFVAFNTLGFPRKEIVELGKGRLAVADIEGCGFSVLDAAAGTHDVEEVAVSQKGKSIILENGLIRVEIAPDGTIKSLYDLIADREALAKGESGNVFQIHPDYPTHDDAWEIPIYYKEVVNNLPGADSVEVVEASPLRASVLVKRSFGNSRLEQKIVLSALSSRVDFITKIDWKEKRKLLKVAFPVAVHTHRATYDIQFGNVERPTHSNTSWDLARFEVCAHKWADLSEGDYGVALLNDCKYGYDIQGHVMRLSLLRAPVVPDPEADQCEHEFTYSLFPHAGDWRMGKVVEEAYKLNVPVILKQEPQHDGALGESRSFFSVDQSALIIETVKNAESENALVVRLYEAHGTRGTAKLTTSLQFNKVFTTNLLEKNEGAASLKDGVLTFDYHPYEILTFKFCRK
jgi:alpha-mannosidase